MFILNLFNKFKINMKVNINYNIFILIALIVPDLKNTNISMK